MLARLWDNERLRDLLTQTLMLAAVIAAAAWLVHNTMGNLAARGIKVGTDFLFKPSSFPISESVLPYDPADPFWWAYVVGLGNTIFISLMAIILATVLGVFVGLARRSAHPLVNGLGGVFVTALRNMPLLVVLLFWYALATTVLPSPRNAWSPVPGVYMTLRGIYVPWIHLGSYGGLFLLIALIGFLVATAAVPAIASRIGGWRAAAVLFAGYAVALMLVWSLLGLEATPTWPELRGFNFTGGFRLSAEFAALMVGLVLYTAAFIGEIVRGGIDAVARGQWEAARALGLSETQALLKIIIPQALRIIIPPLTSQYLSTVKNTTLALAVGYPELGLIVGTVINQTGQAIESIIIMLAVFLTVSLSVSLFMNWYNARVALVTK